MFNVDELLKTVNAFQRKDISLEDFENWFEDNSAVEFAAQELNSLRAAVDAALAQYHFDHIDESAFRRELAAAVHPFDQNVSTVPVQAYSSSLATVEIVKRPAPDFALPVPVAAAAAVLVSLYVVGDRVTPFDSRLCEKKPPLTETTSSQPLRHLAVAVEA